MAETADNAGASAAPPTTEQAALETKLSRSPVPKLHKEWFDAKAAKQRTIPEAISNQLCFDFLGELSDGLSNGKCFDLEKPKRVTQCSCTGDLRDIITDQERSVVAAYTTKMSKMDWHAQRKLAMEWIKYGEITRLTHPHEPKHYLLPGLGVHLICKSSLARLLGWSRCIWNKLKRCV
jgi:hypothetical protein